MHIDAIAARKALRRLSRDGRVVPLLLCRVTLGWEFLVSGWLKIHDLSGLTGYFAELHIPWPSFNATLVAWTELICGGLLLIGLASRLATVPLFVTMAVALIAAKRGEIHGLSDLFYQVEFTYLCMFVVVFVLGPSALSFDAAIARAIDRHPGDRPRGIPVTAS